MSEQQAALKNKHGTPEEFEAAVWRAYVGLWVTQDEAIKAIQQYRDEWRAAERSP